MVRKQTAVAINLKPGAASSSYFAMPAICFGLVFTWLSWAFQKPFAAGSKDALLLGDSWAAYAGTSLKDHCAGLAVVVNRGLAGTTAADWASNLDCATAPQSFCCQHAGEASCSVSQAVGLLPSDGSRVAWVSLGGNDYILSHCSTDNASLDKLQQDIEKVIRDLQWLAPKLHVVVTGYAAPSGPLYWTTGCDSPEALHPLNEVVRRAAIAQNVTFVNVSRIAGGSSTVHSQPEFYKDPIHLNSRGYCKLWTDPVLQEAMGCSAPALRGASC
eukprot:s2191_g6.t1